MANIFGIETGTLHADGRLLPLKINDWEMIYDGDEYLAFAPEAKTADMRYRVAISLNYLDGSVNEPGVYGTVEVIKHPDEVPANEYEKAAESMGYPDDVELTDSMRYEILRSYGIKATVYDIIGWYKDEDLEKKIEHTEYGINAVKDFDNEEAADAWVRSRIEEEAANVYSLLGLYLDRPANKLGATYWDFLDGNLVPAWVMGKNG